MAKNKIMKAKPKEDRRVANRPELSKFRRATDTIKMVQGEKTVMKKAIL